MAGLLATLGELIPDHAYEAAATRAVGAGDGELFVVDVERSDIVWSSAPESALSPVFEAELAAAAKHSLRVQTGDARSIIAPTITGAVLLRAAYIVDPIGRGAVYAACRVQIVGAKSAAVSLLSPREGRIAELLVQGYTALNVALITGITEHTVRTHIRRIYRKFGIRNRSELVHSLAKVDAMPQREQPRGVRRMDSGFIPIVTGHRSSKKASG